MKIGVIGAGFVGLTSACVLAEKGHHVLLIDQDQDKLESINRGIPPFYEEGLQELLSLLLKEKKLVISNWTNQDLKNLEIALICVGTPSKLDGSINLSYVESAIADCDEYLRNGQIIVIKSTVAPGTTRSLEATYQKGKSNLKFAMVPEFLREGTALMDSRMPDRIVIGSSNLEVSRKLGKIFEVPNRKIIETSTFSAESIKYFSNVFLATCISISNELFDLINRDTDCIVSDVLEGWHLDRRFSSNTGGLASITNYLVPGPGFGGSCFPKDVSAFKAAMNSQGLNSAIIDAVIERNLLMPTMTASWIAEQVPLGEKIIVMGVSFKEGTDDLRESPAIAIVDQLISMGYQIEWLDKHLPYTASGLPNSRIEKLADSESRFIILTNHEKGYRIDLENLGKFETDTPKTVLAIRHQSPIKGFNWLHPRQRGA